MGMNYYIHTTDKDFVQKYFPNEYEITDEPYFSYSVHLNKCSYGWKTLFEYHKNAYSSLAELDKFLKEHEDKIKIYNEEGDKMSISSYLDMAYNRDLESIKIKCGYIDNKILGRKTVSAVDDDYVGEIIYAPFDHIEYQEFMKKVNEENYYFDGYFNDSQGYNFVRGSFS